MLTAGIDIGSITAKAAVIEDGHIKGTRVDFTGYNAKGAGKRVFDALLKDIGLAADEIEFIVATGYGRNSVDFADKSITEITCHAMGAHFIDPKVRFIIDVGGQDSKVIKIDGTGKVLDFAMNDKCAAGTGRFLEVMARALEVDLDRFADLCEKADKPSKISSTCTVFAESEIISLISRGEKRENIIAGLHDSVASRISAMARRVGVERPVMMTGGVAKNMGAVFALERKLECKISVSPYAQVNGAIGAAILASRK